MKAEGDELERLLHEQSGQQPASAAGSESESASAASESAAGAHGAAAAHGAPGAAAEPRSAATKDQPAQAPRTYAAFVDLFFKTAPMAEQNDISRLLRADDLQYHGVR